MKLKAFRRWLRGQAKKLPQETYSVIHKLHGTIWMPAEEGEKADLEKDDGNGNMIRIKKVNVYEQAHLVNHYRRLKRGFDKQGFQFINNYFKQRGFTHGESNKTNTNNLRPTEELSVEA